MSYILGANNQLQAQRFVDHLARVTNTGKGSSVVRPARRFSQTAITTAGSSGTGTCGVILGVLMDDGSVSVVYDPSGEYSTGSVISVSLLSAVYGSHSAPGVHVVVFRAQVVGVGGTELNELV